MGAGRDASAFGGAGSGAVAGAGAGKTGGLGAGPGSGKKGGARGRVGPFLGKPRLVNVDVHGAGLVKQNVLSGNSYQPMQ